MKTLYSAYFQVKLAAAKNLFGNVGASEYIIKAVAEYPLKNVRKKQVYNLFDGDEV